MVDGQNQWQKTRKHEAKSHTKTARFPFPLPMKTVSHWEMGTAPLTLVLAEGLSRMPHFNDSLK